MIRGTLIKKALLIGAICLVLTPTKAAKLGNGFDKPVHKTVLDLGSSPNQPDYPKLHIHLSCYYYSAFIVKELDDDGNKGALRISFLPTSDTKDHRCVRALTARERLLPNHGYFWGVSQSSIFVIADDGEGEGQYFEVFDANTLRTTFKDALRFNTQPKFSRTADGHPSMRYQRVFFARCSLMKQGADCWRRVVQQTGLRNNPMPHCEGYDDDVADPSLIAFPVEVVLSAKPERRILAGPVLCFAAQ